MHILHVESLSSLSISIPLKRSFGHVSETGSKSEETLKKHQCKRFNMGMACEMKQNTCQKWGLSAKVVAMQKKQSKKRTLRTLFTFAAVAIVTGSVLPIAASGSTSAAAEEVHVYTLSSSDSDPLGSLKTQLIAEKAAEGITVDPATSTLSAIGFDRSKTGIQNVTLNLSTGKDTLSTSYTEAAAVTVTKDKTPVVKLTTDSIDLYNDATFNPSAYINYTFDETGTLPVIRESDNVDTSTEGTYTATYTVIDLEGRTSKSTLTVNVVGPSPEALAAQEEAEAQAAAEAAAKAAAEAAATASVRYGTSGVNPYSGGWSNCTYGAWEAVYESLGISMPSFGNASQWVASAQAAGYATGSTPRAGSVAVYVGHVAYVTSVSADGSSCYIVEGGYNGHYNERWISASGTGSQPIIGYIYF